MAKPFHELREILLRAGVAPRHVRRYVRELSDHLSDLTAEEVPAGRSRPEAESTALRRLGTTDDLAKAMIDQRQFQSWTARAPWAVFGLSPIFFLAAAYFVACIYLWFLWRVFLPGADTPFGGHPNPGPIYGFQNICFQAGKFYYFAAPVLVGWGFTLIGARQRVKAVWLIVSLVPLVLMGSANRVQASRTAIPSGLGHIRMEFAFGTSMQDLHQLLLYALIILTLTVLPYIIWRLHLALSSPA